MLVIGGRTHIGRVRAENQDTFLVALVPGPEVIAPGPSDDEGPEVTLGLDEGGVLLMVADGMGGAAGGAIASRLAASTILGEVVAGVEAHALSEDGGHEQLLAKALQAAHRAIAERGRSIPCLAGMGTTATVAWVFPGGVRIAQVGDSRAYLVRGERSEQLTRDQTLVQKWVEEGRLTPEEAEVSPRRHVLTGALGAGPTVEVEVVWRALEPGDHLVLCSDGLTGVVGGEELGRVVAAAASPGAAAGALVALANERGGPDNVTVLVATVTG